jgi:hypothetical protein
MTYEIPIRLDNRGSLCLESRAFAPLKQVYRTQFPILCRIFWRPPSRTLPICPKSKAESAEALHMSIDLLSFMRVNRVVLVVVLILSTVQLVNTTVTSVSSQSYVTVTTQLTTTATYTTPLTTQYSTSTKTSYVYGPKTFTMQASTNFFCWYKSFTLNATQGQQFHIEWTTTASLSSFLDFYVLTPSEILSVNNALPYYVGCHASGWKALYSTSAVNGSVDWTAPATGQFVAVFVNNNSNSVSVTASIGTPSATTVRLVSYATFTTSSLFDRLQTVTLSSSLPLGALPIASIALGVMIAVLLGVLARTRKSRSHPTSVKPSSPAELSRPYRGGKIICPNCDRENPQALLFCGGCGTRLDPVDSGVAVFRERANARRAEQALPTKNCPRCGTPSPRDNTFCGHCGWAFDETRVY